MDWDAGMAVFEALMPVTERLTAEGPALGYTGKEWLELMQWLAGAPLDPEMDHLRSGDGPILERLRWITPPPEVHERQWRPFIGTVVAIARCIEGEWSGQRKNSLPAEIMVLVAPTPNENLLGAAQRLPIVRLSNEPSFLEERQRNAVVEVTKNPVMLGTMGSFLSSPHELA
jgi:hypothetical protein